MANPERAQQRQGGGGSVSLSSSVGRLLWSAELGARRGEGTVGFLVCARTTWLPLRASIVCAVACGTIPPDHSSAARSVDDARWPQWRVEPCVVRHVWRSGCSIE